MVLSSFSSFIALIIPTILLLITWSLSARSNKDREKSSPFECGFDPKSTARIPFSMRFFLLAIIFIVFDIEIVLLLPIPTIMHMNMNNTIMIGLLFLIILMLGLIHEWKEGSLDWTS